jgi:hypothetical protein
MSKTIETKAIETIGSEVPITGVIQWFGEFDTGKTTAALECGASPDRMLFVDDDLKGRATVKQLMEEGLSFGQNGNGYVDLLAAREDMTRASEFFPYVRDFILSIPTGTYDALVWDTWTAVYDGIRAFVGANNGQFDAADAWKKARGSGFTFYEGKVSRHAREVESRLIRMLAERVDLVNLITHLKDDYSTGTKTGKQVPANSPTLDRVCIMRVWLRHNPNSPVPIMLFLKRLGLKKFVQGRGLRTVNIMPRKATPQPDDQSVWDVIKRYLSDPVGNRAPTAEETPNAFELSILDGTLTPEQRLVLQANLAAQNKRENTEDTLANLEIPKNPDQNGLREKAIQMKDQGVTATDIATRLSVSVQEVVGWTL